jgi:hypothetical protein
MAQPNARRDAVTSVRGNFAKFMEVLDVVAEPVEGADCARAAARVITPAATAD